MASSAHIILSRKDGLIFPEAKSNDLLLFVGSAQTQSIHMGHCNNFGSMLSVTSNNIRIRDLLVTNNVDIQADMSVAGATSTQNLVVTGQSLFGGHVIPLENQAFDLGSRDLAFRNAYIADEGTFCIGNYSLHASTASQSLTVMSSVQASQPSLVIQGSNIGIGLSNPQYTLHVNGQISTTDNIVTLSDARVKTNVHPIHNALTKVLNINGYTFNFTDNFDLQKPIAKRHAGVLAQEVERVFPEVVYQDLDVRQDTEHTQDATPLLRVSYGNLVPLLLEAIKDLSYKCDCMARDIEQIQAQLQVIS